MQRERQKGGGRLKSLVWVAILVSLIYGVVKTAPHFVNDYEFRNNMRVEARFASVQRKAEADIRDTILKNATELGIPIKREAIKIRMSSNFVTIDVAYTIEVPLPGYVLKLNFSPSADSRSW